MSIEAVLFDKDGTLLDFHATWMPAYRSAAAAVCRDAGRPELEHRLLEVGGYDHETGRCDPGLPLGSGGNAEIAEMWARECGLEDVDRVIERVEEVFAREVLSSITPVGDLAGLFARLTERGLRLGMATMDSESTALKTASMLEIDGYLSFVCGYDSGFGLKPAPGMMTAFCDRLSIRPVEVLIVGDTLHDMHMGRSAGAGLVVGVLSGTATREILEPHCDHVLDDVHALEDLV